MRGSSSLIGLALAASLPLASWAAGPTPAPPKLTADQIIERHEAAKGGLAAWRAVQTMTYTGKMEAGGKKNSELPFRMELKRPRKTRVEIEFAGDHAVQVYDGTNGWKLRPFLGRKEIEPYTADQLKAASLEGDLDGFLIDHAAKGIDVAVEGTDKVEGREAYKLKLTLKGGAVRHLWIDAGTFLETKIEGAPRRMDGKMRQVEIYYREFKPVDGLMLPHVLETAIQGYKGTHKIVIDTIAVNQPLADTRFTNLDLDTTSDAWRHEAGSAPSNAPPAKAKPVARS